MTARIWADCDLIHVLIGGVRIKTVRSHLSVNDLAKLLAAGAVPAGPSPLPPIEDGDAVEVERCVSRIGLGVLGRPPDRGRGDPRRPPGRDPDRASDVDVLQHCAAGKATGTVVATEGHPFWLPELREWVPASAVRAGDLLQTSAGTWVQVASVRAWTASHRVHNLTVDGLRTYYVLAGATPVLVHNSGGCPTNLQSGNSAAASRGTRVHNGPEWGEHLDSLGYSRGHQISPGNIPDGFTADGFPVELKPNTKSGIKAGTRQLRRYMNEMGVDYGELWTYRDTPDGIVFDLVRVPNGARRWTKW
ncbi:MAG TPA: polymorphic toxin-type HINT domain-containing protein [Pseudonocardiaceae bacterium]